MTFQTSVNNQPGVGIEGGIASANPCAAYVTGPNGLISGAAVTVARFGWTVDGLTVNNSSVAAPPAAGVARVPQGFIPNNQQGLFSTFSLAESGVTMLPGQAMGMYTRGDFWAKMPAAAAATINPPLKAFANLFTGAVYPAAAGAVVSAASMTASFATSVMTVTVNSGSLVVGQAITGTGVPANTYILSFGTMTGAANATGTVNLTTSPGTVGSAAGIVASNHIETSFAILSACAASELAKIGFGN